MKIPLSSPDITQSEIDAVTAVLRTPHLSLGPELASFEAALAAYHGMPHAIAVSSGTAALHLALLVLGIGEGDEVIIPSFAFIAVANTVLQVRATPVFADIDPVTLNLDPTAVERAITPRTRALLIVHTFGVSADMDALQSIARRHNLLILEDACEAIGAEFGSPPNARRAGSFGDLAVFGFYPNKQLTTGEGGAVLARNPAHAARLRSLLGSLTQASERNSLYELCCHPGYDDAALDMIHTRLRETRDIEREALLAVVPEILQQPNAPELIHYGNLGVTGLLRESGQHRPNTGYESVL